MPEPGTGDLPPPVQPTPAPDHPAPAPVNHDAPAPDHPAPAHDQPAPAPAPERPLSPDAQRRLNDLNETLNETADNYNERLYMQTPETGLRGRVKNILRRLFFIGGGTTPPADFSDMKEGITSMQANANLMQNAVSTDIPGLQAGYEFGKAHVIEGAREALGTVVEAGVGTGALSGLVQFATDGVRACLGERSRNFLARHLMHKGIMNFPGWIKRLGFGDRWAVDQANKWKDMMGKGKRIVCNNEMLKKIFLKASFAQEQVDGLESLLPAEEYARVIKEGDKDYFEKVHGALLTTKRMVAERFSARELMELKDNFESMMGRERAMATAKIMAARTGITALKGFTGASLASAIIGGVRALNLNISGITNRLFGQTAHAADTITQGAIDVAGQITKGAVQSYPEWETFGNNILAKFGMEPVSGAAAAAGGGTFSGANIPFGLEPVSGAAGAAVKTAAVAGSGAFAGVDIAEASAKMLETQ